MSPSERFTHPSNKSDSSSKTAVLPTDNSPGDSANTPNRVGDAKRGQFQDSGKGKQAAAGKSNKNGSAFKSPSGKSPNADNKR